MINDVEFVNDPMSYYSECNCECECECAHFLIPYAYIRWSNKFVRTFLKEY